MSDTDIAKTVLAAQEAAAQILKAGLPPDVTACIVIVPLFRRAVMDPASGWRGDAIAVARQAIEASSPFGAS